MDGWGSPSALSSISGISSPPPSTSPHTVGMKDRSSMGSHYVSFIKTHLDYIFSLLYNPASKIEPVMTPDQLDLLSFLLCGGYDLSEQFGNLSDLYTKWEHSSSTDSKVGRFQKVSKVCKWVKKSLCMNEVLYPPVGFALGSTQSSGGKFHVSITYLK